MVAAQDARLLYSAQSRSFVLQQGEFSQDWGTASVLDWEAEGLDPQDAVDLAGLLGRSDGLTQEEALRLQALTLAHFVSIPEQMPVTVVLPFVPEPPLDPILIPSEVGGDFRDILYSVPPAPACPNGLILFHICERDTYKEAFYCSCD